jgi:hypothetical protein
LALTEGVALAVIPYWFDAWLSSSETGPGGSTAPATMQLSGIAITLLPSIQFFRFNTYHPGLVKTPFLATD